jgi:hypothetical protein
MRPVDFVGSNLQMQPPEGMEDCVIPMMVWAGGGQVVECWTFDDDEELKQAIETRKVWVSILSGEHRPPPIAVAAHSPMRDVNGDPVESAILSMGKEDVRAAVYSMSDPERYMTTTVALNHLRDAITALKTAHNLGGPPRRARGKTVMKLNAVQQLINMAMDELTFAMPTEVWCVMQKIQKHNDGSA